jgi:hypothetical protein
LRVAQDKIGEGLTDCVDGLLTRRSKVGIVVLRSNDFCPVQTPKQAGPEGRHCVVNVNDLGVKFCDAGIQALYCVPIEPMLCSNADERCLQRLIMVVSPSKRYDPKLNGIVLQEMGNL